MENEIIFCPHCNQKLTIEKQYIGMVVQCPTCNQNFTAAVKSQIAATVPANDDGDTIDKFKNFAAGIKNRAAVAASNLNSRLDQMQSGEDDLEYQNIVEKIERIKKGIPVRKIYLIAQICVITIFFVLAGLIVIFGSSKDPIIFLILAAVVFLIFFIISIVILEQYKNNVKKKTSNLEEGAVIDQKRRMLAAFFSNLRAANSLANTVENLADSVEGEFAETAGIIGSITAFFIRKKATAAVTVKNIYNIFNQVRSNDLEYLETLDVLPRFGKNNSQLAAEDHTLYSPLISEGAKYNFNENGDFIYDKEEVTKVYTFEDQLLIFTALWDYTTGELYNEQTEAFFFRDITDISTENSYDKVKIVNWITPPPPEIKPFPIKKYCMIFGAFTIIASIVMFLFNWLDGREAAVGVVFVFAIVFFALLLWLLCYDLNNLKKIFPRRVETIKRVRASETFTITSTSGRSTGMTILCDGWFEAKNGKFEKRSDGEKIIHAIRKMIEEKKVSANE